MRVEEVDAHYFVLWKRQTQDRGRSLPIFFASTSTTRRTRRCYKTGEKTESSQYVWAHGVSPTRWPYSPWPASNSCNYTLVTHGPLAVSIGCASFHFLLCSFVLSQNCHAQPQRHLHFADEATERREA